MSLNSLKYIDISPSICAALAVWPGDVPFERNISHDFLKGDNMILSSMSSSLHLGAHTDAPNHYHRDGAGIDQRDLRFYFGVCQVIEVSSHRERRIYPDHLDLAKITSSKVLLKTNSFPDPKRFNEDFWAYSPELIEKLAAKGVELVGIDTPSVDPFDDQLLLSHNAIYKNEMAILEGVILADVTEGHYTLSALPLKIKNADASPVRAILMDKRIGEYCEQIG